MSGLTRRELLASTAATIGLAATGLPAPASAPASALAPPVLAAADWLAAFSHSLCCTLPGLVTYGMRRWYGTSWDRRRCPPIIVVGENAATMRLVAHTIGCIANHGPFVPLDLGSIPAPALEARLFEAFRAADRGILFLDQIDRLTADLDRRVGGLVAYGADVWVVGTAWRRLHGHETPDALGRLPLMGWPLLTPPLAPAAVDHVVRGGIHRAREALY
jgi:hypothetical protein